MIVKHFCILYCLKQTCVSYNTHNIHKTIAFTKRLLNFTHS